MKSYTELVLDLRDLCLLTKRKSCLTNAMLSERFQTSERHLFRQRRLLRALGAKIKFCHALERYYFENDFSFDFGTSRKPATAERDARYLAQLPVKPKGDTDFPIALFNRLRMLAQIHLMILYSSRGTVRQLSTQVGISEKQWYNNLLILQNLGAEIKYDQQTLRYRYQNDFWIGLKVGQAAAVRAGAR